MVKTVRPFKFYLVATLGALSLAACNIDPVPGNTVTKVSVTPASAALAPTATQPFTVSVSGTGTYTKDVTWSSSNEKVARVSAAGVVTAVASGTATIRATSTFDSSKSDTAGVTVAPPNSVTSVTVSPATLPLQAGATGNLSVTVQGTGSYAPTVTWSSSNTSVATVSPGGIVTAVAAGSAVITAKSTADSSKSGSAQVTVGGSVSAARLNVTNVDGGPFAGWLSFNKVDKTKYGASTITQPSTAQHTISTVRLSNTGSDPLLVTPSVSGNFALPDGDVQRTIAPGQSALLRVQFTGSGDTVQTGVLTLSSNDPTTPKSTLTLAGAWQPSIESSPEPTTSQLINQVLGFKTAIPDGTAINKDGQVIAQGDEIISPYWQRVNSSQPVNVWQIASYHTIDNAATLYWHPKAVSKSDASSGIRAVVTSAGSDAQSLFPHSSANASAYARVDATPPATTFGFRVDNNEWSDPTYNSQDPDISAGCPGPCGQHLRFFRAKDPSGAVMPDTYLLIMDYSGINYDYNDNIFLITNIRPAPVLIDTGLPVGTSSRGNVGVTAPDGTVWFSDQYTPDSSTAQTYKFFSPAEAFDEPKGGYPSSSPSDIKNTTNDVLYKSYRGNTSAATPDDRTLKYAIPLDNGTYRVTLHFADLAASHTAAGQRVFDVSSNGALLINDLDIVKEAGAPFTALDKVVTVPVTSGSLNLTFAASVDYPSISAIEINRP